MAAVIWPDVTTVVVVSIAGAMAFVELAVGVTQIAAIPTAAVAAAA